MHHSWGNEVADPEMSGVTVAIYQLKTLASQNLLSLADLREPSGGPPGQISFIFMQFSAKILVHPTLGLGTLSILDPSVVTDAICHLKKLFQVKIYLVERLYGICQIYPILPSLRYSCTGQTTQTYFIVTFSCIGRS